MARKLRRGTLARIKRDKRRGFKRKLPRRNRYGRFIKGKRKVTANRRRRKKKSVRRKARNRGVSWKSLVKRHGVKGASSVLLIAALSCFVLIDTTLPAR